MEGCFKVIKEEERKKKGGKEEGGREEIMRNPSLDQCVMEHKDSKVT